MNFPLHKLESHIDEASLIRGEELLEAGAAGPLSELEKHLWLSVVEGQEVEVQITPTRVIGATCDCKRFRQAGMCEHLAAVLMALRRQQQTQQEQRDKAKQQQQSTPRKLTTGIVLDNVSKEELIDFVRDYARANRNFAIALKARFASSVSEIASKEKYLQLLDSTINAVRKPDRSITLRGSQRLASVLEELQQQSVQAIDEADFTEAANIAQSIIEKATPVLKKTRGREQEIRKFINKAFENLHRLVSRRPAPSLLSALQDYALTEHSKLVYRSNGIDQAFFKLLLLLCQEPQQEQQLLDALEKQKEKYKEENRPQAPLLLLQLNALEKAGRTAEARHLMEYNLSQPDILQYAINQAHDKGLIPRVKALAITGLKLGMPPEVKGSLEEMLLQLAEAEQDWEEANRYAVSRFLDTLQYHYFEQARHTASTGWTEQVGHILQQLLEQPYSTLRRNTIGRIYAEEGRLEALMDYVEQAGSLDLLLLVGKYLVEPYQDRLFYLYRRLLADHLKNHLGRKTSQRIREVLAHLYEIGAGALAEELVEEFRSKYPDRHSLMEELALLNT
ncbi:MAG: SWIM zinc finger family protein [Phaeodactylibacter sp.]|nr:SWIM zinc finger family protein [Phaeodactylibacter sp.]